MTTVEIEFCLPCGHLDRAETVQHVLLTTLRDQLTSVTLVPSDGGIFTVTVDDEIVFDISDDEYDVDQIVRDVRATT